MLPLSIFLALTALGCAGKLLVSLLRLRFGIPIFGPMTPTSKGDYMFNGGAKVDGFAFIVLCLSLLALAILGVVALCIN